MSWLTTLFRRTLFLTALAGLASAGFSWWRGRTQRDEAAAPEWPPLDVTAGAAPVAAAPDTTVPGATSVADADETRPSGDGGATWVAPNPDGTCPITHPIKANDNSGIFHVPGGRFYDRTGPERCYSSAEAAIADGYRQAKS